MRSAVTTPEIVPTEIAPEMRSAAIAVEMSSGCNVRIHASAVIDRAFGLKMMASTENVWTIVRTIEASAVRESL